MSPGPIQSAPPVPQDVSQGETIPSAGDRCVSVEEGYRRWAPSYDRDLNPLLALEERQLKSMLPSLAGKRVLDLACGTGRWLAWVLAEGARSGAGVDISWAMLAGAREKARLQTRLVRADCCNIPFAAGTFDLVISSFALSHLSDLESAVREVARVAAPGAAVYVSDLHPQAYARGWRTGFRDSRGGAEIMSWDRSIEELLAAWNSAGFVCVELAEFRLGEPEKLILALAGKANLFAEARQDPAVLAFHFQKLAGPQSK